MKKVFSFPITVTSEHIDSLKHVNNEIYIKWLLQAADAHSSSLGFTVQKFLEDNACFVVRRHEVDYLAPAYLGEELIVDTWITYIKQKKSTRVYNIKRKSDERILIRAQTLWVYIDLATGKPIEIPEKIIGPFLDFLH
jgi:acyl-CoA thioester hydrolase